MQPTKSTNSKVHQASGTIPINLTLDCKTTYPSRLDPIKEKPIQPVFGDPHDLEIASYIVAGCTLTPAFYHKGTAFYSN